MVVARAMPVYPAGHLARRSDRLDSPRFQRQSVNGCQSLLPLLHIPQAADKVDAVSAQRGSVKIGRRKNVSAIAVNLEIPVAVMNHNVVVHKKVGVVIVLVLSPDLDETAVGER